MKIFFLNPPYVKDFCRSARWAAKSRGRVQRHPDYMLISAGLLEQNNHEVDFIDGAALNYSREEINKRIINFAPDLIVIHTTTPTIYNDLEYAFDAKKVNSNIITVAVGTHVSALPKETFELSISKFSNSLDIICIGEYDFQLLEIANNFKQLNTIKGIVTYKNGFLSYIKRDNEEDINKLPEPAWHFIKPEDYPDAGKRFPFLTLIHARGCVGNCSFCCYRSVMNRGKIRYRAPELVIEEILHDLELFPQIKEIMFETDTFATNSEYTENLCQLLIKNKIKEKISWSCNMRVDTDLSLLPIMKEAGCRMLMTGFEFGTQKALDAVGKGTTLEQAKNFANTANKLGFIIHGCFMIGAPGETFDSARATIDFAKSLPCDTVQFSGLCPYPGTRLYDWAKKNKYLIPNDWTEWVNKDYEQCTLLTYPDFTSRDINTYIDKGLKEFYLRPKQIYKMLKNIGSISDLKRKLFGFFSFIDYFNKKNAK